jgi:gluconolactonase
MASHKGIKMSNFKPNMAHWALALSLLFPTMASAQTDPASQIAPILPAAKTLNLMTSDGMAVLDAQWKNMDARIVEVPAMEREVDTWPMAYDIDPHAGGSDYDDSDWPIITGEELATRRGGGRIFFTWYRTTITIPENIDGFETAGSSVVLDLTVDDYAEVWVNGELPRSAGRPSPGAIQGFNIPNRILLSEEVTPGEQIDIAVFGINGPISLTPLNTVWFRHARLEFIE